MTRRENGNHNTGYGEIAVTGATKIGGIAVGPMRVQAPAGPVPVSRTPQMTRRENGNHNAGFEEIAVTGATRIGGIAVGPTRVQAPAGPVPEKKK